ncbi:MAG: hypothetical protein ACKN9U_24220 [Pirellulaceae bacterium]
MGRWIPAVESLHGYDAQMLRRDVVAGGVRTGRSDAKGSGQPWEWL